MLQGERRWPATTGPWAGSTWTAFPPAPRGVPQIEVTFDIDANGILHVSAKDLGTGKEQTISITASVRPVQGRDQEDGARGRRPRRRRQEEARARPKSATRPNLVYSTEKTLKEHGDKLSMEEKKDIEASMERVRTALKGDDSEAWQKASEELAAKSYKIGEKIYKDAKPEGGASGDGQARGAARGSIRGGRAGQVQRRGCGRGVRGGRRKKEK